MPLLDFASLRRMMQQSILVGLRGASAISKFALTIYIARYLELSDLGAYGLLVGAATMAPAIFGFGLTDWTSRHIVRLGRDAALPFIATRLTFSAAIHLLVQPLAWMLNFALGTPVPWHFVFLIGAIIFLEHLGTDLYFLLVARRRPQFASVIMFMRSGLWPPIVIVCGLLFPAMRTIDTVMIGWLSALIFMWLVVGGMSVMEQNWRAIRWRWRWFFNAIPQSLPFFMKDICGVSLLYLDRFLISFFLGLELAGVYTFFWSIASVINSLVAGLIQTHLPDLVGTDRAKEPELAAAYEARLYRENAVWAVVLSAGACIFVPLMLPYIDNPLLEQYLPLFWLIIIATLIHVAADAVSFLLFAARHDRAFAMIVLLGAPISAAANVVFIPGIGIYGAGFAYIVTSTATFVLSWVLRRHVRSQHA